MKITKRFTYSDVNTGYIHLANIKANAPTVIKGESVINEEFISHTIIARLKFIPTSGPVIIQTIGSGSLVTNLVYDSASPIYTETDGELQIELFDASSGVSTGELLVMVDATAYPIS